MWAATASSVCLYTQTQPECVFVVFTNCQLQPGFMYLCSTLILKITPITSHYTDSTVYTCIHVTCPLLGGVLGSRRLVSRSRGIELLTLTMATVHIKTLHIQSTPFFADIVALVKQSSWVGGGGGGGARGQEGTKGNGWECFKAVEASDFCYQPL